MENEIPSIKDYDIKVFSTIGDKYYLSDNFADFYFVFEMEEENQYERIPAHKLLLSAESDVFRTMFNETWKEKTEVEITDSSPEAFREFLQFFYCNQVKLTSENIDVVFYLGTKYNVAECLRVCEDFLKHTNIDNLLSRFDLAIFYENIKLKKYYEISFFMKLKNVLKSNSFLKCSQRVLLHILSLNVLWCKEKKLFDACMSWVKETSGQTDLTRQIVNTYLGEAFRKIRFGAMSLKEFNTIKSSYTELFSIDEQNSIVELITTKKSKLDTFSAVPRSTKLMPLNKIFGVLPCNRAIKAGGIYIFPSTPRFINKIESTLFTTNTSLYLAGFGRWLGSFRNGRIYELSGNVETEISIYKYPSTTTISDKEHSLMFKKTISSPGSIKYGNVSVFIEAGCMYEIRMELDPPQNSCCVPLLNCEVQVSKDITVNFHQNPETNCSSVDMGLIYELLFLNL